MSNLKTKKVVDKNLDTLQRDIEIHLMKSRVECAGFLRSIGSYDLALALSTVLVNELIQPKMFVQIASAIGRLVCSKYDTPELSVAKIRNRHFDTGALLLVIAKKVGIVKLIKSTPKKGKHATHMVAPLDINYLIMLSFHVKVGVDDDYVQRPSLTEPSDYESFYHPYAAGFIHKAHPDVRRYTNTNNCGLLYRLVNQQMKIPYAINIELLNILKQCKGDEIFTKLTQNLDEEQRASIEFRDARIFEEAERVGDNPFWLYSYLDYRSRLYYCSSYMSPQGTGFAKSLIKFDDKVALGEKGYWSLLVNASNTFGHDKAPLEDRFRFAEHMLGEWMEIANDPINNKSWQDVDDPFNFLAAILEIKAALEFDGPIEQFQSNLMVGWDCTNSGLQILSALTRDRVGASQCNLLDTDIRSDFYMFVADKIWEGAILSPTKKQVKFAKDIMDNVNSLNMGIYNAIVEKDTEAEEKAREMSKEFIANNKENLELSSRIFWGQDHIYAKRRSIVKRGCLSYFYDCGARSISRQIVTDFEADPLFKGITYSYANWVGHKLFKVCQEEMPAITKVMEAFKEMARRSAGEDRDFEINLPLTGFKMKQWKQADQIVQKHVNIGVKKSINVNVVIGKLKDIETSKAVKAAPANVTHSFDATLLYSILNIANYQLSLVHDCYFAHAGNADRLLKDSRQAFRELFEEDHLKNICAQNDAMDLYDDLTLGDWSSEEMLNNQYCIS